MQDGSTARPGFAIYDAPSVRLLQRQDPILMQNRPSAQVTVGWLHVNLHPPHWFCRFRGVPLVVASTSRAEQSGFLNGSRPSEVRIHWFMHAWGLGRKERWETCAMTMNEDDNGDKPTTCNFWCDACERVHVDGKMSQQLNGGVVQVLSSDRWWHWAIIQGSQCPDPLTFCVVTCLLC